MSSHIYPAHRFGVLMLEMLQSWDVKWLLKSEAKKSLSLWLQTAKNGLAQSSILKTMKVCENNDADNVRERWQVNFKKDLKKILESKQRGWKVVCLKSDTGDV